MVIKRTFKTICFTNLPGNAMNSMNIFLETCTEDKKNIEVFIFFPKYD